MFDLIPSDHFKLKFDASHSIQAGRDYLKELAEFGPKVVHLHAKDISQKARLDGAWEYVPAGMGVTDSGAIIEQLYRLDYHGAIAIEPHSTEWCGPLLREGIIISQRHLQQFTV